MALSDAGRARAVDQAMHLFWQRGVTASAYPEIVAATGLSRRALYEIWPDKTALVTETIAHYRATVLAPLLDCLEPPGAQGLVRFWTRLEYEAGRPGWNGCYLIRSASGELRSDPVVREAFDDFIEALNMGLLYALLASRREMHRSRVLDTSAAAWQAVGLVVLASSLGGQAGYDSRVAEVFRAGRLACGLPPA